MKIVYFDSYPPRSWLENGEMKGILIDIISEVIQNRLGIPLIHEGYPWARAQAMVESGLADAFITIPTEKRRTYTVVGQQPVIQFNLYIATQKNNPKLQQLREITSIKALKPFRLVDYHGNGFAKKELQGFNVEWLPELTAVYPFLAAGKADVMLTSDRSIYDMVRLGYQEQLVVLPQTLHSLSFHLCIGKKSAYQDILPKVDQTLRQMQAEGLMKTISQQYYQ